MDLLKDKKKLEEVVKQVFEQIDANGTQKSKCRKWIDWIFRNEKSCGSNVWKYRSQCINNFNS